MPSKKQSSNPDLGPLSISSPLCCLISLWFCDGSGVCVGRSPESTEHVCGAVGGKFPTRIVLVVADWRFLMPVSPRFPPPFSPPYIFPRLCRKMDGMMRLGLYCRRRHHHHHHPCHRCQLKPIYQEEVGPAGLSDPPLATLTASTPEKKCTASSFLHHARIAFATTIPADADLGLWPHPPYPRVDSPPSWCPAAMTMILCLSIARPNAATTEGNPSKPLTDTNAIVEGNVEMETP